jgi:hypothetical protein
MARSYNGYPFLLSRDFSHDYRVIVIPDFIPSKSANNIIKPIDKHAKKYCNRSTDLLYIQLQRTVVGDLTSIFRPRNATKQDIGQDSKDILQDEWGRNIRLYEGIVLEGVVPEDEIKIPGDYFNEIHIMVINQYRIYWDDVTQIAIKPSLKFEITDSDSYMRLIPLLPIVTEKLKG